MLRNFGFPFFFVFVHAPAVALESINYWIGMVGVVAFAVTGVLAVAPKGVNLFGVCVLGLITAIGGGTVRDLILDVEVFWATDQNYLWVALGASLIAFSANSLFTRKEIYYLLLYVDGLGAALFAIQSVDKVWNLGFGLPVAPVLLGLVTAIGGGLIRDVLSGRQNLLLTHELYATPVLIGCVLYVVLLRWLPTFAPVSTLVCVVFVFGFRAAAIHWNLSYPQALITKPKAS